MALTLAPAAAVVPPLVKAKPLITCTPFGKKLVRKG
jgi:hypothetical protein